jgi:predicted anti-sigma-YlaC factor YlaD
MDCEKVRTLFVDLEDEALSPELLRDIEEHLKTCDSCRTEWHAYKQTVKEISGMYPIVPPEDFTLKVKETIGRRSKGRFFNESRTLNLSFAIVSFVLILLFALIYLFVFSGNNIEMIQ